MKLIANPNLAYGYTDVGENQAKIALPFKASAAVAAGDVVIINTDGTISPAATGSTASLCIGVAEKAIAANAVGLVTVLGVVDNCVAQGAIAAGDQVKRSGTTAAAVAASAAPAAGEVLGVAIAASSGGVVSIYVSKAGA